MVFKDYKYGVWKKEIRDLLKKRLIIKDKIRYHRYKADYLENNDLSETEKQLNDFLKKAGNKL